MGNPRPPILTPSEAGKRLIALLVPISFPLLLRRLAAINDLGQFVAFPIWLTAPVAGASMSGLVIALGGWHLKAARTALLAGLCAALVVVGIHLVFPKDSEAGPGPPPTPPPPSKPVPKQVLELNAGLVPGSAVVKGASLYALDDDGRIVLLQERNGMWFASPFSQRTFSGATALSSCLGSLFVAYGESQVARVSPRSGKSGNPWTWQTESGLESGRLNLACDGTYVYVAKADVGMAVRLGSLYPGPGLEVTALSPEFSVGSRADSITATRSGQIFAADRLGNQVTTVDPDAMTELEPAVPRVLTAMSDPGSQLVVNGRLWVSQYDSGCLAVVDGFAEARLRPDIQLEGGALHLAQTGSTVVTAGQADGKVTLLNADDPSPGATYTRIDGNPSDLVATKHEVLVAERNQVAIYSMRSLRHAHVFGRWRSRPCRS